MSVVAKRDDQSPEIDLTTWTIVENASNMMEVWIGKEMTKTMQDVFTKTPPMVCLEFSYSRVPDDPGRIVVSLPLGEDEDSYPAFEVSLSELVNDVIKHVEEDGIDGDAWEIVFEPMMKMFEALADKLREKKV